jgi:chemotaxis protein methyltransferase CheR
METLHQPTAPSPARTREFAFTDEDFEALRALVKEVSGITLGDMKRELVYGRLSRRLRALGLRSFAEYRRLLCSAEGAEELEGFTNAVTTNLTAFFREGHHFDHLRDRILLPLRSNPSASRRLRIWSAGCSTGEEPYSIAMTIAESIPEWQRWDIRILATDLDSEVLARGRSGRYREDRLRGMSRERIARFFVEHDGPDGHCFAVTDEIASMVTFGRLNLMDELPMRGPLDVIFCRNVVIYFDKPTQRELFARIERLQRPGDTLFLGHSESLFNVSDAWRLVDKTTYRRSPP